MPTSSTKTLAVEAVLRIVRAAVSPANPAPMMMTSYMRARYDVILGEKSLITDVQTSD